MRRMSWAPNLNLSAGAVSFGFGMALKAASEWSSVGMAANLLTTEHPSFVQVVRRHVADLGVMFEESSNGGNPSDGLCLSPF